MTKTSEVDREAAQQVRETKEQTRERHHAEQVSSVETIYKRVVNPLESYELGDDDRWHRRYES